MTSPKPSGGGTLVVQALPGIGDMIWHLSHVHAIATAAPGGKVSLLVKPRTQADRLLAADPTVGEVLWLERNPGGHDGPAGLHRLSRMLAEHDFAAVWILHGSWRYGAAARLAGIPRRIGFGRGRQRRFVTGVPLPAALDRAHPIERATRLLALNGLPDFEPEPCLPVVSEARARVRKRFSGLPRPWIALGIGSSEPARQWGDGNFAALVNRLGRERRTLFLVAGTGERDLVRRIVEATALGHGTLQEAIGLPIEESVALAASCRVLVGNDTGMLNVAAAVGVDAFGLFGASPALTYSRYLHPIVPADPAAGMAGIPVEQVAAAVEKLGAK